VNNQPEGILVASSPFLSLTWEKNILKEDNLVF